MHERNSRPWSPRMSGSTSSWRMRREGAAQPAGGHVLARARAVVGARRSGTIERAIANLLDNAAKWSPPGAEVEVEVRDGQLVVRDHGPGIADEDLPTSSIASIELAALGECPARASGSRSSVRSPKSHGGRSPPSRRKVAGRAWCSTIGARAAARRLSDFLTPSHGALKPGWFAPERCSSSPTCSRSSGAEAAARFSRRSVSASASVLW